VFLQFLAAFFDGICGAVVGVIAVVAFDILKESVSSSGFTAPSTVLESVIISGQNAIAAVIYVIALAILYKFTHRYTAMYLVLGGALAGQFLFI
jgi:hypothetical protein